MKKNICAFAILLAFGSAVMIVACSSTFDSQSKSENDHSLDPWDEEDTQDPQDDPADNPNEATDPKEEVCDGRDNDDDGETDEGFDGIACETPDGEQGIQACIAGKLRCRICEPGTTRESGCGCGIVRLDICGEDGVWRQGACDACDDPAPVPCGFCGQLDASGICVNKGECMPGDIMYRRCDACPESTGCGPSTCVGEKWECAEDCNWQYVEGCEVQPSECERDARLIVPCGQCGLQILECDGCFWNRPDCREQGSCFPGASEQIPCFGKNCRDGWGNNMYCSTDCEWVMSDQCIGCEPGVHTEMVNCVYNHPRCGKRELQHECVLTQEATDCLPAIGTKMNFTYLSDCPPIECYPGQQGSEYCTLDSGEGGLSTRQCTQDCEWPQDWSPCTAQTSSCVPGAQEIEEKDCGCDITYSIVKTCRDNGLSWDQQITGRQDCPECEAGDSYSQGCTTSDGRCGTMTVDCDEDCGWNTNECQPRSNSCVAGSTESRSCNHMCGSGTGTYTCIGCNWYLTGECVPNESVDCDPGETRTVNCNPEGCPQQQDVCSGSCHWIEGNCPACG